MGILSWIIFGLIAGILAKWIMPGKDGGGFIVTVILGIIGAVVGEAITWVEILALALILGGVVLIQTGRQRAQQPPPLTRPDRLRSRYSRPRHPAGCSAR